MGKKVKFGIIGCGVISNWHAEAVCAIPDAELIGVTDVYEPARKAFAEKYNVKCFESVEELLKCEEIDAVSICTPSGLHAPLAIQVANAGKSIVVEKPMAITKKEIDEIFEAVERNHVKVGVISQLRFSKPIQVVKKLIDDGKLGKIVVADLSMKYFRSQEYYDKSGWRGTWKMDGGGALMNQGIHGIDILQYLMGPVKSVSAFARTLARKIEVEDTAVAILEFENGALGQIVGTTSITPGFSRVIEICGDEGSVALTEGDITTWEVKDFPLPEELKPEYSVFDTSSDPTNFGTEGHTLQLTDFVEAMQNDRLPLVNQYDGKKPVEIILAIYESSKTGKTVNL